MFANELSESSLCALINGEIFGIWHKSYLEKVYCQEVMRSIRILVEKNIYTLTDDLQSLGTSMGEAHECRDSELKYFRTSISTLRTIRDVIFRGILSPIDRLRLELDELWPYGANIGRSQDHEPMLPGTIRRWPSGGHANPHMDQVDIKLLRHLRLTKRIAANTYLQTPPGGCGGDLEFWDLDVPEREYESMKRSDYGLDREKLGEATKKVQPRDGDLVLFDAHRIHGVAKVQEGVRVTAACFIGVVNNQSPLFLFA